MTGTSNIGIVSGDAYYYVARSPYTTPNRWKVVKYQTGALRSMANCPLYYSIGNWSSRRATTFDGENTFGFTLTSGGEYHYFKYDIANDTLTNVGEYDVVLQLDRNNVGTVPPNDQEKLYEPTERKVYKISKIRENFNLYANLSGIIEDGEIVGIHDEYLFAERDDGTIEIYNLKDKSDEFILPYIYSDVAGIPEFKTQVKDYSVFDFERNQNIVITSGSEVLFEGFINELDYEQKQEIKAIGFSKELQDIYPQGSYSSETVTGAIGAEIDDECYYCDVGELTGSATNGSYVFNGRKTFKRVLDWASAQDYKQWYLHPTGSIFIDGGGNYAGVDANHTSGNLATFPRAKEIGRSTNKVIVYGAYVGGEQLSGVADDDVSQLSKGIIPKIFTYSNVNDQDTLDTLAANLLDREDSIPTKVEVGITGDMLQVGEYINFEFDITGMRSIPAGQYIIESNDYDIDSEINYLVIKNGISFGEAEIDQVQENKESINQVAEDVSNISLSDISPADGNLDMNDNDITNVGTIDGDDVHAHISSTSNPHSVTASQLGLVSNEVAMITPSSDRDPGGSSYNVIQFDNDYESSSSVVNADASNDRIIAELAGWYLISCTLRWVATAYAPGRQDCRLTKNGTAMSDCYFTCQWDDTHNNEQHITFTVIKDLNANDYIKVETRGPDIDAEVRDEGSNLLMVRLTT